MTLVVLHGANASGADIEPLSAALRPHGEVFAPNLLGHGGRPLPPEFTLEACAEDVLAQMDERGLARAALVGYSAGGLVALHLARHHPERVAAVCGLAVKVVFDEETVKYWHWLSSVERLSQHPRGKEIERLHRPQDWREVVRTQQRYFLELGRRPPVAPEDLAAIRVPAMLVSGDRDRLVPWAEVLATGRQIPGCRIVMFYGVAHPIQACPLPSVARVIGEWLKTL